MDCTNLMEILHIYVCDGCEPPTEDSALNELSTLPKGECRKMSAELNSTIDDRSSSTYADAQGSKPVARDESVAPVSDRKSVV